LSVEQDDQGAFWWDALHWDGSRWQELAQSATMGYSRAGDVHTFMLSRADLGNPTAPGFTLYVSAVGVDAGDNVIARDYAPDSGDYGYLFSAPAPAAKPAIGAPATIPAMSTQLGLPGPTSNADADRSARRSARGKSCSTRTSPTPIA